MKKLLTILAAMTLCASLAAQTPDNEAIRLAVANPSSQYFYPELIKRYMAGDLTLTAADYHHLYYGYAFQDSYQPLEPISAEAGILMLLEGHPEPDGEVAERILELGREVMQRDPFSPRNINFMAYAYAILGDTLNAQNCMARLDGVLRTIEASGDGLKEKTAWHVISFDHVVDMLDARGLEVRKRMVISIDVEYVELRNPTDKRGYYFDSGRVYWNVPEHLKNRERPKGLKFENFGPKFRGLNTK